MIDSYDAVMRWRRERRRPTRGELIDRKHALEGEIAGLAAEIRRRRGRGDDAGDLEARLGQLRSLHYRTRLDIERTGPDR